MTASIQSKKSMNINVLVMLMAYKYHMRPIFKHFFLSASVVFIADVDCFPIKKDRIINVTR